MSEHLPGEAVGNQKLCISVIDEAKVQCSMRVSISKHVQNVKESTAAP